jgi:hypothetical protein
MSIDLSGLPRRLTVVVGDRLEIALPSYLGSGNAWSASCLYGADIALVTVAMTPPDPTAAEPGGGPPEPRLATERAVVRGLAVGESRWRLTLARSFGPPHPTATYDLDIDVTMPTD